MKDLLKTLKLWEIVFIIACVISIIFFEFVLLSFLPLLLLLGIIPSVLAFKEKKYYIVAINTLVPIVLIVLYFILW